MIHSLEYTGEQLNTILRDAQTTKTMAEATEAEVERINKQGIKVKTSYRSKEIDLFGISKDGLTVASRGNNNKITVCKVVDQANLGDGEIEVYYDKSTGQIRAKSNILPNKIVLPGNPGAGVGIAEDEVLERLGLAKMDGSDNPNSENFGNYVHSASGSIMVYIPKHYQKYTNVTEAPYYGLRVDISNTQEPGYFLPRIFINAGAEVDGIFIDKYTNSFSLGYGVAGSIPISVRNVSCIPTNRMNALKAGWNADNNNTINNISAAIDCVKARHERAFCLPFGAYSMMNAVSDACWQEAWRKANVDMTLENITTICAWADMEPYRPRCAHNSYTDIYDKRVVFRPDPHQSPRALIGGVEEEVFAKTTHNGQRNGVCLGGNTWEHAHGFYHTYIYKESCDIISLTRNECLYNNVPNNNKFEKINVNHNVGGTRWLGNSTTMPWNGSTDRTDDDYKRNALGQSHVVHSSMHRRYGNQIYYNTSTSNQTCLFLASWYQTSGGGPRDSYCSTEFAHSSTNVSFRTALYP